MYWAIPWVKTQVAYLLVVQWATATVEDDKATTKVNMIEGITTDVLWHNHRSHIQYMTVAPISQSADAQ